MCLAIPMKIITVNSDELMARADYQGCQKDILISLTPDVEPEDYVLVHAGYAIEKLDVQEAEERQRLFNLIEQELSGTA
jgi:hydrogenase expression/formation protein HypC